MSGLKKKYYDGFQIQKILREELDNGETIMKILSRFADEPSAINDDLISRRAVSKSLMNFIISLEDFSFSDIGRQK